MKPVYSVLILDTYPYVFGVYSDYSQAEEVAVSTKKAFVIAVHDFIDSKVIGDILREVL